MADLDKVLKGNKCCIDKNCEEDGCPYFERDSYDGHPVCIDFMKHEETVKVLESQHAEIERLKKNIKIKNARLKIMKADKEYWRNMWLATLEENDD